MYLQQSIRHVISRAASKPTASCPDLTLPRAADDFAEAEMFELLLQRGQESLCDSTLVMVARLN